MKHPKTSQLFCFIALVLTTTFAHSMNFPPANVNVVPAKMMDLSPVIWVSGTVVSQNDSKIASEISGRLVSLSTIGALVERGDVIARIDDKQLIIQHREAQANVLKSEAHLRFLEAEVTRKVQLVKQKLSPSTELEKTISERDIAKGDVIVTQAQLDTIEQALDYTTVKAPFSGIVAQRLASLGEFVNDGKAIIRLVETQNSEATIFAPIVAYQFLKNAKQLVVQSPLGDGKARIKTLVPVANARSHLMEVRLDMSTFDWPIGLNIKAKVANGPSELSLAVPRDALVLRRDGASIFRVNQNEQGAQAEQIAVTVGIGMDELVAVTSTTTNNPINTGDLIVIRGAERLQNGQGVAIKANNNELVLGGKEAGDETAETKAASKGSTR